MEIEELFKEVEKTFKTNTSDAALLVKKFLNQKFKTKNDMWAEGAKRLLCGAVMFSLWKTGSVSVEKMKKALLLKSLDENRRENLGKILLTAPEYVQEHFAGIVDCAQSTFSSYFSIASTYVNML